VARDHVGVVAFVVEVGPRLLPGLEVPALELGQLQGRDDPAAAAGPVDAAVVHADQVSVGGQPDIALERVRAVGQRLLVRPQRVLGQQVARAAMGHHLRTGPAAGLRTGHLTPAALGPMD
jgi:hypothetical protein